MAIDSAEKRLSISGIPVPLIPGVTPNSGQDGEWRQESGWSYSGISVGGGGGGRIVPRIFLAQGIPGMSSWGGVKS